MSISNLRFEDELKKINSDETKPLDTLIGETKSLISSQHSNTNNLINTLKVGNIPIVNSVQRGNIENSEMGEAEYLDVTVSSINLNKSILTANACVIVDTSYSRTLRYEIINATTIRFHQTYADTSSNSVNNLSWQLTEFY